MAVRAVEGVGVASSTMAATTRAVGTDGFRIGAADWWLCCMENLHKGQQMWVSSKILTRYHSRLRISYGYILHKHITVKLYSAFESKEILS